VHPRTLSRYSATNYCRCKAKWRFYFTVGRDNSFGKWCTVDGFVLHCATVDYVEPVG